MTDDFFGELMEMIRHLTGLGQRDAARVAMEFGEGELPTPQQVIDTAISMGFDVERKHGGDEQRESAPLGRDIEMDPATVITSVYLACPRVQMAQTPRIGKAPQTHAMSAEIQAALEQMPEEVVAAIVDINVFDGSATFWLHDEANNIDRPIGPIDLTRYTTEHALVEAMYDLMRRINKVLAADTN